MLQSKQWNGKENNFQNYFSVFTIFTNFEGKKDSMQCKYVPLNNLQDLENLHRWW